MVAAKVVSGHGLPCLVAGHKSLEDASPVELDQKSLAILEPHGVLSVLRPYATSQEPFTITSLAFENGLKHHCVADMLVTVFDNMSLEDAVAYGDGVRGKLTDGLKIWDLEADAFLDVNALSSDLNGAIHDGATFGERLVKAIS